MIKKFKKQKIKELLKIELFNSNEYESKPDSFQSNQENELNK